MSFISFFYWVDFDGDRLYGLEEINNGTNPFQSDTDFDGISDYDELHNRFTNPILSDTDSDGIKDGDELVYNTDPRSSDTDNDMWDDYHELFVTHTDPIQADTDDDWIIDSVDSSPLEFLVPSEYRIISYNHTVTEYKRNNNINYKTEFDFIITTTRKPITEEETHFLFNSSLVVNNNEFPQLYPNIKLATSSDENPSVSFEATFFYLKNGTYQASFRNYTISFEIKRTTFYFDDYAYGVTEKEHQAIMADLTNEISPNKFFGLALVFGVRDYDEDLGLRIYAFRGSSIEASELSQTKKELESTLNQIILDICLLYLEKFPSLFYRVWDSIFSVKMGGSGGYFYINDYPEYRLYYQYLDLSFPNMVSYSSEQSSVDFTKLEIPMKYVSVFTNVLSIIQGEKAYAPLFVYLSFPKNTVAVLREISEGNSISLQDAISIFHPWESQFSSYPTDNVYFKLNSMSLTKTFIRLLYGDISEIPSAIMYGIAFYDLRLILGKIYVFIE